jgi:hypothetical protein
MPIIPSRTGIESMRAGRVDSRIARDGPAGFAANGMAVTPLAIIEARNDGPDRLYTGNCRQNLM